MKKSQKGMAGIETILIIVIIAALVFVGWYVYKARKNANANLNNAGTASQTISTQSTKTANQSPLSNGSDNASLQNDLSSVDSSQAQASTDAAAANNAVNDQQSEVSIPSY